MSPDEIRVASVARFRQAKEAVKSGDIDKALELLGQALELAPESAQVRRTLRDVQCQAVPPGNIPSKLVKLKLVKLKAQIKVMDAAGDWANLLKVAEEAASIDPWDIEINAATAAACLGMDYRPAAFLFYQRVAEQDPTNTKFLRRCATMLEAADKDEKAFEYWQRINEVDPEDALAQKRVKEGEALGFHQPKQAEADRDDIEAAATKYLESDTILDEGDTAHGEKSVPSRPPVESSTGPVEDDSGLDPDSGLSADSGIAPDSGMSSVRESAPAAASEAGPDGPPAGPAGPPSSPASAGPSGPPSAPAANAGPPGPPIAPAAGGPSGPPQKAGPDGPPQKAGPARTSAGSDAGPPGAGPSVAPPDAGPSSAPGAGPSGGPRFSQTDLLPGAGPVAPPTAASAAPTRRTAQPAKAFAVPIPGDMPDHVQNLLTVAGSLVARDRSDEACAVLEKALTIAEGDDWIEGMLLALKRKPR